MMQPYLPLPLAVPGYIKISLKKTSAVRVTYHKVPGEGPQDMAADLSEAIYKRNVIEVKKLLDGCDPNEPIDWMNDGSLVGPPLVLAIDNLDTNMVRLLVEELGADVDQDISIAGKKSTLLIYAVKCLAG